MTTHDWRERTEEGLRLYRASRFARQWTITTNLKGEEEWVPVPAPWTAELLLPLRDVLWAKYQRRRVPVEHVQEIERMLPEEVRKLKER